MVEETSVTPLQQVIGLGFSGFLTLVGVALMIFGLSFIKSANTSRSWPSTQGTVQNVRIVRERSSNSSDRYAYIVSYTYVVDERTYVADRYSLGTGSTAGSHAKRAQALTLAQASYPRNSAVEVYYDPTNPAAAVLKPGANIGTYVPLILGCVFGPTGLWLLISMVQNGR